MTRSQKLHILGNLRTSTAYLNGAAASLQGPLVLLENAVASSESGDAQSWLKKLRKHHREVMTVARALSRAQERLESRPKKKAVAR